ncbi:MAG TPA: DUF1326 domain-containing protein [Candidatus Acidoferrales bacterium]|nr:DUF1326 domain-containing protein [Candidatus Acidoferrales bacterium]
MAWRMKGEYIKNCSCMASCTCDADGRPSPNAFCEGAFGMLVTEGNYEGVKIDGTKWLATVHFPKAMFEGNGHIELYIDKGASEAQRTALLNILSGKNGGPIMEIIAAVAPNFHGPHFDDIDWEFDYKKRTAHVKVGNAFETRTAPIAWPPDNVENHVIVKMPNGFEYKECEVAHAKVLKSTGHNKFDWENTHASLALVDHTDKALVS